MQSVLVVDDDTLVRETVTDLLDAAGFQVTAVEDAEAAIAAASEKEFDTVLSDIHMPGKDGIDLLGELRELRPKTPVVLMTGHASVDSAVGAMKAGAFDYVTKPFSGDALIASVTKALEFRGLEQENARLRRALDRTSSFGDLIGASPAMHDIFALIRKISGNTSNVLITGESGTGKDVVARTIHFSGTRKNRPYVPINCTAMPEGLLESELFGHVRGAFTGAHTTKKGLFEEADGGTIFLDEIGDMPASLQAKLLRVLQDREVRPVGATQGVKVDVRVIAATNQRLDEEIKEGRFRNDLYFRLNVIPINIPPLRERPEDIGVLAEAFLRKHGGEDGPSLSVGALEELKWHEWEGNGRELENVIERAIALCSSDTIEASDLMLSPASSPANIGDDSHFLEEIFERKLTLRELGELYTEKVLSKVDGRKSKAAEILGVNRRTLYRRGER